MQQRIFLLLAFVTTSELPNQAHALAIFSPQKTQRLAQKAQKQKSAVHQFSLSIQLDLSIRQIIDAAGLLPQ